MADERPSLQELIAQAAANLNAGGEGAVPEQRPMTRMQQMVRRYGPRVAQWARNNPQAVQSFLASMGLTPQNAAQMFRAGQSRGFPVTRPGDQTFTPGMNPRQAEQQIIRNQAERDAARQSRRAQTRGPDDAEFARRRLEPMGVLAQTLAMANPAVDLGASLSQFPQLVSSTAADEFKGSEAEKNMGAVAARKTEIEKLQNELIRLQGARDRAKTRRHADPQEIDKVYERDSAPVKDRLKELQGQLDTSTKSKEESEKGYLEYEPWYAKAARFAVPPVFSAATSYPVGRHVPGPAGYALNILGGAAEGALGAFVPELVDLTLPETSPARQKANANLKDWDYWLTKVAPEAGVSATVGGLSGVYGHKRKQIADAKAAKAAFGAGAQPILGSPVIQPPVTTPPVRRRAKPPEPSNQPKPWGYGGNLSTAEFDEMAKRPRGRTKSPADDRNLFFLGRGMVPPKED